MQIILQGEHFNLQCAAEPQLNWLAYPYLAVGLLGGVGWVELETVVSTVERLSCLGGVAGDGGDDGDEGSWEGAARTALYGELPLISPCGE